MVAIEKSQDTSPTFASGMFKQLAATSTNLASVQNGLLQTSSLLDQAELANVDLIKVTAAQEKINSVASGKESIAEIMRDPKKREELLAVLQAGKEELKKMVGAEVTDPVITQSIEQMHALANQVENFEKLVQKKVDNQPGIAVRVGYDETVRNELYGQMETLVTNISAKLEAAIPYCIDKIENAKVSIQSMTSNAVIPK